MNNDNVPNPQPIDSQSEPTQPTDDPQLESSQPDPIPVTGIFTDGVAQVKPAQFLETSKPKNPSSKKILPIAISAIVVIAIGIAGFFLISKLLSTKKTVAEFKQVVSKLGYTEVPEGSQETDEGKTAVYMKGSGTNLDGIAMFLEAPSKESLKQMMKQSLSDMGASTSDIDFSKDYTKALDCYSNKTENTCIGVVLKENTALFTMSYSNSSEDVARAEIEKVIDALGYQE